MLVLSRRLGESIRIGPDVEVRVVEVRAGQIKLGITAPREVRVLRTELLEPPAEAEEARAA